ncbi:ODV-E66 [Crangon crangon nudivirus]|uniref:ODV-E66 n=1 Tax=Crangon crangon nudivirus TaxID=2880838 RepID=A0AAE8Y2C5_9VIRU|nr:ODV-E66 [Crangon crangon nudivirus]UBZ25517.1 ODV-E66 [Crangon crangon nudivirus]
MATFIPPGPNTNPALQPAYVNTHKHAIRTVDGPQFITGALVCIFIICIVVMAITYIIMRQYNPNHNIEDGIFKYKKSQFKTPDFTGYDIETQGKTKYNWHIDDDGLVEICHFWNDSMGYYVTHNEKLTVLEDWLQSVIAQLRTCPFWDDPDYGGSIDKLPWGRNWESFTIELTRTMCYYMLLYWHKIPISALCAEAIKKIIRDPQYSLGWSRDKNDSATMLFPWTKAYMFTGNLDTTHPAYLYAIDQYDVRPDTTIANDQDGLHIDWGYLARGGIYDYGGLEYLYDSYQDTKQIVEEVGEYKLYDYIDEVRARLLHPTIQASGGTLFTRKETLDTAVYGSVGTYTGTKQLHPIQVIPSMRYIRYFTEDWQWCVRGVTQDLCYYESDQWVSNMGLYAMSDRSVYYKDGYSQTPKLTTVGFMCKNGVTELPEVIRTEGATTEKHYPIMTDDSFCFVVTDHDTYALMLTQSSYELVESNYSEHIVIDIKRQLATLYGYSVAYDKNQFCSDGQTMGPRLRNFKYTIDFAKRSISDVESIDRMPTWLAMTEDIWNFYQLDSKAQIAIKLNEVYCYIPHQKEIMDYEVFERTYPVDEKDYKFKFDRDSNQYLRYDG